MSIYRVGSQGRRNVDRSLLREHLIVDQVTRGGHQQLCHCEIVITGELVPARSVSVNLLDLSSVGRVHFARIARRVQANSSCRRIGSFITSHQHHSGHAGTVRKRVRLEFKEVSGMPKCVVHREAILTEAPFRCDADHKLFVAFANNFI